MSDRYDEPFPRPVVAVHRRGVVPDEAHVQDIEKCPCRPAVLDGDADAAA